MSYERMPQIIRDLGFIVGSTLSWQLGALLVTHHLENPEWLPLLVMIGARILFRITQLEQRLKA